MLKIGVRIFGFGALKECQQNYIGVEVCDRSFDVEVIK